jgi:hypothetical protein
MKVSDCLDLELPLSQRQMILLTLVANAPPSPAWYPGNMAAWPWKWARLVLESEPEELSRPPMPPPAPTEPQS